MNKCVKAISLLKNRVDAIESMMKLCQGKHHEKQRVELTKELEEVNTEIRTLELNSFLSLVYDYIKVRERERLMMQSDSFLDDRIKYE